MVLACSFDPTVLSGPLILWLEGLTGLPIRLQFVGFGATLEALRDPRSAWNANRAGVNALVVRLCDLEREEAAAAEGRPATLHGASNAEDRGGGAAQAPGAACADASPSGIPAGAQLLADALGASPSSREGRTILLLAPPPETFCMDPTSGSAACAGGASAPASCSSTWLSSRGSLIRRLVCDRLAGCRGLVLIDEAQAALALRRACGGDGAPVAPPGAPAAPTHPSAFHQRSCYSPFLDQLAQAPFSPTGASALAAMLTRAIARACAPARKLLALDCDNTLWGGAVAELGADGVDLSEPWLATQRKFVAARQRGMLLALLSRNHERDVRAVLSHRRAEMALREEHLVAVRANWDPKSSNLRALADQLCLSVGSFVFVDDSPAECSEVARAAAARAGAPTVSSQPAGSSAGASVGVVRRLPLPPHLAPPLPVSPPPGTPFSRTTMAAWELELTSSISSPPSPRYIGARPSGRVLAPVLFEPLLGARPPHGQASCARACGGATGSGGAGPWGCRRGRWSLGGG